MYSTPTNKQNSLKIRHQKHITVKQKMIQKYFKRSPENENELKTITSIRS